MLILYKGNEGLLMYKLMNDLIIYELPKELDHYQADLIKDKTEELFKNKKIENIVFDFEKTEFMDSSGIGLVTGRFRKVMEHGGNAYAINVNEKIDKLLMLSGIYRIIEKRKDMREIKMELNIPE